MENMTDDTASTLNESTNTVSSGDVFITTTAPPDHGLPVFGLPGYQFTVVHATALAVQPISITISAGVFIYLLRPIKTFFSRPIGNRLVVYLALCDLFFSVSHTFDHAYMLITRNHPPDPVCMTFALLINEFIIGQAFLLIFVPLNSFVMVVLSKKITIGKYDWRLLAFAFGVPMILGILGVSTGNFGPSGAWCYIDMRRPLGLILGNLVAAVIIITFGFNVVCYLGVWLRIRQVALAQTGDNKYHRSASIMMVFVVVYILQWWGYVFYAIWGFISVPPFAIFWFAVFFSNVGGLFNFLAYTLIRKKYQSVSGNSGGNHTTVATRTTNA